MSRGFLAVVLAVALGVRIAFFLQWTSQPFLESPVLDARGYLRWAEEIASGHLAWDDLRIHGPGYPFFLATVLLLTGHDLVAATFANSLLGCAWIVLLWLTVRRHFPRPTAEVTALLAAVYWPFLHFEGHLLATTWFTALLVLAAWIAGRALDAARPRPGLLFWTGLTLGAATVTRPNAAAILPFLLAIALLRAGTAAARRRAALLLLGGFAVLTTPVLVLNWRASGMIALQDHTMFNLYLGNGPESRGVVGVRLGREWDELAEAPALQEGITSHAGKNAWFRDRITEHARNRPVDFLALQARKAVLFWNAHEFRVTLSPYFFTEFAPLQGRLPGFGTVGPLALVGLFLAWGIRPRPWLLYAFSLPAMALVVFSVVGSRYRLPVVPFLMPFAAWTAVCLVRWAACRRPVPLLLTAAGLAAAAIVVHHDFPDLEEDFGGEYARVASVLQESGNLHAARGWWERALAEDPGRLELYPGYVGMALTLEDWELAERVTRLGLEQRGGDTLLLMMRGRALLMLGDPEESLAALRPVLGVRPRDPDLLAGIARAHAGAGRADSALVWFRTALATRAARPDVAEDAAALCLRIAEDPATPTAGRDDLRHEARILLDLARTNGGTPPPSPPPSPEGTRTR